MPSTIFFCLFFFRSLITHYRQLADRYGADIASDILKRTTRASTIPDTPQDPKPKFTNSVHPYPFNASPHTGQSLYRAF